MGVRLENYLFRSDVGTYKEVNEIISSGRVKVNGVIRDDNNYKVDPESDFVGIDDKLLSYRKYAYIMMNKPIGYVCTENDRYYKSVLEFLPEWCIRRGMKAAYDLDVNISGLVLITDDLSIGHSIKSFKKNTELTFHVQTNKPVTIEHVEAFSSGMKLRYYTGEISVLSKTESYFKGEYAARLQCKNIRYKDIVTMFKAMGIDALSVELIAHGDLVLPYELDEGDWRELDVSELKLFKIKNPYK